MRRKVSVFSCFAAVLLSSLFFSCNQDKKSLFKVDNKVEFDTINIEKKYFLDDNPENPSCNLKLTFVYPERIANFDARVAKSVFLRTVIGSSYDSLSVQEAVDRYARDYIANYRDDAEIYQVNKPLHDEYVGDRTEDLYVTDEEFDYLPEVFYSYYENLSDSIVYNQFGIISFQVRQVNNKGGRMSYETVRNYVLDLSSGKLMTEDDIFSAGYDLALRPILQGSLLEAHGAKSVKELEDLGFFGIDEIVPNKNFLINDKGITYTFNKGEYSAYQLQVPQVFIPYTAIRSLLCESSVVSKLARLE